MSSAKPPGKDTNMAPDGTGNSRKVQFNKKGTLHRISCCIAHILGYNVFSDGILPQKEIGGHGSMGVTKDEPSHAMPGTPAVTNRTNASGQQIAGEI